MPKSLKTRSIFLLFILLLILTNLTVLLNIPVLRQVSSFIFLTFIPGFLLLLIFKLNKLRSVEKIVLSVGLSIAFVMLFGLVVNFLSLAVGYTRPLSIVPLLIAFSAATVILAAIAYIRNRAISLPFSGLELTIKEKALLIVPALFPLLSMTGICLLNFTDNNVLVMFLLFLIPAYVIFISFYHSKVPEGLYPLLTFLFSVSLVLLQALRSNHIVGSDVHQMYGAFQNTLDKLNYSVATPSLVDSLASTTIFPAIYQAFLKINPEYHFKVLIPLLFSISPLVVYVIARKYIGGFYAFLTSFLFMSQIVFFRATDFASASIATLLFALAIMVLFHDGINEFGRKLFFFLFITACIVSHYSTSIIFFFILVLTWIGMQIMNRVLWRGKERQAISKVAFSKTHVSVTIILLFFAIYVLWHAQITRYAFGNVVGVIQGALMRLPQSFELESKSLEVSAALGQMEAPTVWKAIRLAVYWLEIIFIAIGGLSIVARYKSTVAYPDSRPVKTNPLESKFELEYLVLSAACAIVLTIAVILPYISQVYVLWRSYFQVLVVLSLYFAIGGVLVARWLRTRPQLIMLAILIPYFMYSTGVVEYAYGVPSEIWLTSAGSSYSGWYVHDEDSYAAQWIGKYRQTETKVYSAGIHGVLVLTSQGGFSYIEVRQQIFTLYRSSEVNGYIYLRNADITDSKILEKYPDLFATKSKIYTAGTAEISSEVYK